MISLPLYPELFLFLSPLDEMEDPDNKLDEKHCVKLITTIISFGRIMSESAVNMTVFGNELVKIYPPSELYEEVTIFEMVTALLPEIACHDIIPYLCARSDYSLIRSFIMSMIIIVMGAIFHKSHQRLSYYLSSLFQFMEVLIEEHNTAELSGVISDSITFILDLGVFTHLARFILASINTMEEVSCLDEHREMILFGSLYSIEILLRCCILMTAPIALRVLKELSKSTLVTVVMKELLKMPMVQSVSYIPWNDKVNSICWLIYKIDVKHKDMKHDVDIALDSEGMQGLTMAVLVSLSIIMDRFESAGFNGIPPSNPLLKRLRLRLNQYTHDEGAEEGVDIRDIGMIRVHIVFLSRTVAHRNCNHYIMTTPALITKKRLGYICKRILDFPEDKFTTNVWSDLKSTIRNIMTEL